MNHPGEGNWQTPLRKCIAYPLIELGPASGATRQYAPLIRRDRYRPATTRRGVLIDRILHDRRQQPRRWKHRRRLGPVTLGGPRFLGFSLSSFCFPLSRIRFSIVLRNLLRNFSFIQLIGKSLKYNEQKPLKFFPSIIIYPQLIVPPFFPLRPAEAPHWAPLLPAWIIILRDSHYSGACPHGPGLP